MKCQISLLTVIALMLAACGGTQKPVDLTGGQKEKAAKYQLGTVAEKRLSSSAKLPGQLLPFNQVNIFPKVNGFVKQLLVDRGTVVKKGQLMAILEAPEMESAYQAANSKYLQAKENADASHEKYERLKQAAKEPGSVSPLDLDDASSKMKADMAMVQAEKSNVNAVGTMQGYLRIYAPFNGVIIDRNVSPGALVAPGKATDQPMLVLQTIDRMRLTVSIPEDYVDKVDLSQPVSFVFNAMPGKKFSAKISRSANSLGSMQQEAIEIDVFNPDGKLKPGMYAEVAIPMLTGAKSLLVPNNAIIRSTEHEYVIQDMNGRANLVNIKEGLAGSDSTEVFGNLKAGNRIVLHGNDEIKSGTPLN
ncbi:efflux RND transporter periplasmic adaptor subunit [Mucilaginibacter robiniae]|uniref:Efflux RND transporter periplasmic adaptor subunit n=2 Tax=Mucilaginibacter robiniae TaxID=2728022 RepID=A0A7L5ED56_9SPHI|nr:efflux RND transporter periplasmic adaptor subunit [Mucilaginibacter robiniae]